jgi:uncharacterized phage protein (TIGR01671 family)
MREIKFRAWDKEEKVMWQPLTLDQIIRADWEFETKPYEYTLPWKDYMWSQHDKTVWMQFTGLKDKDGEEIYEGDVIEFSEPSNVSDWSDPDPSRRVVQWDSENSRFTFYWIDGSLQTSGYTYCEKNTEKIMSVIGNIYENPDLLK